MLTIDIPGWGLLQAEHLVIDVNGTLTLDGEPLSGVAEVLDELAPALDIIAVTADTRGTASQSLEPIGVSEVRVIERGREAEAKLDLVDELGGGTVIAIGNGANDELMLRDAALGIAVIGPEGCAAGTLAAADVVVGGLDAALGLLTDPRRLIATLRR